MTQKQKIDNIVGDYQFGFITDSKPIMDTGKGINEKIVRQISEIKKRTKMDDRLSFRIL